MAWIRIHWVSLLLLPVLTGCSNPTRTFPTASLAVGNDAASVSVCDSLKAAITQRSANVLGHRSRDGMLLPKYSEHEKNIERRAQVLVLVEERLYGSWQASSGSGLCQASMEVLTSKEAANEVAHFMKSHNRRMGTSAFYDKEFQNLAKNRTEWKYVDYLIDVWDRLDELADSKTPANISQAMTELNVPRIGVNAFSQQDLAKSFVAIQRELDADYRSLPLYEQIFVSKSLARDSASDSQ